MQSLTLTSQTGCDPFIIQFPARADSAPWSLVQLGSLLDV